MPLCPHRPGQEYDFSCTWRGKGPEEGGEMISCWCLWLHRFVGSAVAPPASLSSIKGSDAGGVFQALVLKTTHAWVFWFHPLVLLISPVSGG